PGVLGIEVDLAARERGLDQLGRAEAALVRDRESLRLERLLVELTEDVLLGEVLRADHDRRPGLGCRAGRAGKYAEDDRDPQRDSERRFRGPAGVLPDHSNSFRDWS